MLLKFAYAGYDTKLALELNFALFAAYFTRNLVLDDANIAKIGQSVGMDAHMSEDVLKSGKYEPEVLADGKRAVEKGIYAIPYFDFDGMFSIRGSMLLNGFKDALKIMLQMRERMDENSF